MNPTKKNWLTILGAAAFTAASVFAVYAQDDAAEEAADAAAEQTEDVAEDAQEATEEAADEGGGAAAAAEGPPEVVKPRPAEILPLAARSILLDAQKVDGGYVVVGDRGHILMSPDGKSWQQVNVPVRAALTAVHFPDPQNGWAVGHDAAIVATQDGGRNWSLQNFQPELEKPFLDVLFLDASTGFAVGAYGLLYQTTDGGQKWSELDAASIREEELHFNAITRLNNGDLFIVGESGMLGVSKDQGQSWERLTSPYESSLFGAVASGEKGALIFGLRGNAYLNADVRSGDWKKLETNTVASLFGGAATAGGGFALVGLSGTVLLLDATGGGVREIKLKTTEKDKATGAEKEKVVTGSFSSVIAWGGGILAVGEEGVQTTPSL